MDIRLYFGIFWCVLILIIFLIGDLTHGITDATSFDNT